MPSVYQARIICWPRTTSEHRPVTVTGRWNVVRLDTLEARCNAGARGPDTPRGASDRCDEGRPRQAVVVIKAARISLDARRRRWSSALLIASHGTRAVACRWPSACASHAGEEDRQR